jgi:hypothetical protein
MVVNIIIKNNMVCNNKPELLGQPFSSDTTNILP